MLSKKCIDNERVDIIEEPLKEGDGKNLVFPILLILLVLIAIVYLLKKKNIIVLSVFILVGLIVVANTMEFSPSITGYVALETREQQMQMVCEIAEAYDIEGSILLTVAHKESSINHYNSEGSVKIAGDCGVGITQQQYSIDNCNALRSGSAKFICGTSSIDGRQLDASVLRDNIECGAIELWRKCNTFNCHNNEKEYYCANSDNSLPAKKNMYSGWDLALRAYNGWGCMSYYYRDLWGASDPRYINLINRIQHYVEDFHAIESQYESYCGDSSISPSDGDSGEDGGDNDNIAEFGDSELGYYYLNPSFRVTEEIDLEQVYNELAFSSTLIQETLNCVSSGGSYNSCAQNSLSSNNKQWNIDFCSSNVCGFSADTGFIIINENYESQPFIVKFALTFNESGVSTFPDFEYDEVPVAEIVEADISRICDADIDIILFGDSITADDQRFDSLDAAFTLSSKFRNTAVTYSGVVSETATQSVDRIDEIIELEPDVVILWHGMNLGGGKNNYKSAYTEIIQKLVDNKIKPVILTPVHLCEDTQYVSNSDLEEIRDAAFELESDFSDLEVIDVYEQTKYDQDCDNWFNKIGDTYDVHPSSYGHEVISEYVVEEFENFYECDVDYTDSEFVHAIDISHWSGQISGESMQCLKNMGYNHVIVGTQNPTITDSQIRTALKVGMTVDIYTYLYWDSVPYLMNKGMSTIKNHPIGIHWIDVEEKSNTISQSNVISKIRESVNICEQGNVGCGIYASPGLWHTLTGNTNEFSHLPLWYAHWDELKNMDSFYDNWYGLPKFGGWENPSGKQYVGTSHPCGVNADLNVFYSEFIQSTRPT